MTAIVGIIDELRFWPGGTAPSTGSFALNQTTDAVEFIFQAPEAITITRLGFRQQTLTGVAPVFRVSLQGVDGSGNPDGTIKASSAAFFDYTPTVGNNSTWQWVTLGASYTCARGEVLAMVITYQSGTIDGTDFCTFTHTATIGQSAALPYVTQNDATVRTRQAGTPITGYGSSTVAYGQPISAINSSTFNSASTPDERALLLTIPAAWCSTYKILGAVVYCTLTAGTTYDLVLYDTDGTTVLQTVTMDTDDDAIAGNSRSRPVFFGTATLVALNAGSSYRLAIRPSATNFTYSSLTVAASADMDAYFGGSAVAQGSSRTDAGAWTDSAVTRYGINPILADITVSGGAGGLRRGVFGNING